MKRKNILLSLFLCFILSNFSTVIGYQLKADESLENNLFSSLAYNIVIPDDYDTIQEGINNANPGDIIFVKSDTYKENLIINIESLTIIGEEKKTTIVDGDKNSENHAVYISAPNVTFKGFTVKNGWNENEGLWDLSGILINASNTKIIGNIITENRLGIFSISKTYNHTIKDNVFINDGLAFGNYVYNHHLSILDFRHTVENNTVNGKPLYYFCDINDFIVPEDAGQVLLVNCTNVTIKNLNLNNTDFFINLAGCKNCNVINNTAYDTDGELILFLSENNTIQNNTISNSLHAICCDYYSKNNIVRFNEVYGNWIGISSITGSKSNKIYSNKIYKNKIGIEITTYHSPMISQDHEIYQNQIYDNGRGILINKKSENLSIFNNSIHNNLVGINIASSENNNISENYFFKNIVSALFFDCVKNIWNNNYWDRPRIIPKVIYGYRAIGKIPIPWINIDKDPL